MSTRQLTTEIVFLILGLNFCLSHRNKQHEQHDVSQVFRTEAGKQLPVYTDYRNGRTRCMTIVRRFRGDEAELAAELSRVCDNRPVIIRPGRVEVKGNYRGRVCEWLARLGF
jgi:translation initiation factor 1 (eIF-1/SUI1)